MSAILEHANVTVADPAATAAWMETVFGWHIRWQGEAIDGGFSIHVGSDRCYLALYNPDTALGARANSYRSRGGLNHIAVIVDDFEQTETAVKAAGYTPGAHHEYEPGRRFYFRDENGIEFEIVQYDQAQQA